MLVSFLFFFILNICCFADTVNNDASFVSNNEKTNTVDVLEEVKPLTEDIKKKKVNHVVSDVDKENPAYKKVLLMLSGFEKMGDNKQNYKSGKYSYEEYKKNESNIAKEISAVIDFRDVCEKSLKYDYDSNRKKFRKDHWIGKTEKEKQNFISLFQQLIENIVYPIANDFFGDLKIEHKIVDNKPNSVSLKSTIYYKKKNVVTDWFLQKKSTDWKIYDIGVEGERWVTSFRSQFTDIITKKSYQELLKLMKKKLDEIKEENARKDKNVKS